MLSERVCPRCQENFEPAVWQEDDGPCWDGYYYCTGCIMADQCGCPLIGTVDNTPEEVVR